MGSRHHGHEDYFTRQHQQKLAVESLHEAQQRLRAKWYASSVSQSYQVAHRAAAGLLLARGVKIFTEKEVRFGLAAQFVDAGTADASLLADYDRLDVLRQLADFEHDHHTTKAEAQEALAAAERFWAWAQRVP